MAIKHQQNQEDIHSFQILKTAREYAGQKQETIPININVKKRTNHETFYPTNTDRIQETFILFKF